MCIRDRQLVVGYPVEREYIYKNTRMHRDILEHFFYKEGIVFLDFGIVI